MSVLERVSVSERGVCIRRGVSVSREEYLY